MNTIFISKYSFSNTGERAIYVKKQVQAGCWLSVFLLMVSFFQVHGQSYRSPLDLPLAMSANFAELRPNHFHAGIDYRVGGVVGAKLYAVQDGFISRIYVSPSGYGKAIYISHPDGKTTVYGHLNAFAGKIAAYAKELQYKYQRFTIDDYPDSTKLIVKKGDLIGFAGNSGSSFGAHLHFEVRNSANQAPLNPITMGYYKAKDSVPPTVKRIAVFTLDSVNEVLKPRLLKAETVVKGKGSNYVPAKQKVFSVHNPFYFGVVADDYQQNNHSRHAIHQMKAFLDGTLFFSFKLDEFEFKDTRCVNSLIAYEELRANKQTYVKTFVEQGNTLPIYKGMKGNGLLSLKDTLPHAVRIEFYDDNGNKSVLAFSVKKAKESAKKVTLNPAEYITVHWNDTFNYFDKGLQVSLPEGSLYSNAFFTVKRDTAKAGAFSPLWTIGNRNIPMQKKMSIKIQPKDLPKNLYSKALIVRHDPEGKLSACGSEMSNQGYWTAQVYDFGTYSIAIDTIPPKVILRGKTNNFTNAKTLSVTIADNLSGIASYAGYIDDEWILCDYDSKNNMLTYTFDSERLKKGKTHQLRVEVTDYCGNKTILRKPIIW